MLSCLLSLGSEPQFTPHTCLSHLCGVTAAIVSWPAFTRIHLHNSTSRNAMCVRVDLVTLEILSHPTRKAIAAFSVDLANVG